MMLLDSRCRCTLFSVSALNIRKTKFSEYWEFSLREIFGGVDLTGGSLLISFLLITLTFINPQFYKYDFGLRVVSNLLFFPFFSPLLKDAGLFYF